MIVAAYWSIGIAICFAVSGFACIVFPAVVYRELTGFSRHRGWGVVLTIVVVLWSTRLLFMMPMGSFEHWKPALYVLSPLICLLIIKVMDELLAPRALGGMLALFPAPLLDSVRWHPSVGRLGLVLLAYAAVAAGCMLILSPYLFRQAVEAIGDYPFRWRLIGFVFLLMAVGAGVVTGVLS